MRTMPGSWLISMATKEDSDRCLSELGVYTLTPGWATKYYFASVDADSMGDASVSWSYRELANFEGCAILEITSGTTPGDFIRNDTLLLVASDKLIETLQAHRIRSFSTYRVKVMHEGRPVPGYHGLAILGEGGPNDPSLVEHYVTRRGTKSRRIYGLCPTDWDGSEVFTLDDMPRVALATERVRQLFKKERITNSLFEPAGQFKVLY